MNKEILHNFEEKNNNIPYISWAQDIGNFELEKNKNDKKTIENAKVYYHIYWINSLEELKNTKKKITVVIPALTWTDKIFNEKTSQWDWWANTYWAPWNILDPNENIVIWLNYFWSWFNNHSDKHNLDFYPVPPEKQVEAWKKALLKLGIKKIDILFWGSNWGWHIHHWILQEDDLLIPDFLIPIAWPIAPTKEAKEFFKIQLDFLNWENTSSRLETNLKDLRWQSKLFDILIDETKKEILQNHKNTDDKIIMKIVRQIGFLKFVWPSFFDKFYYDQNWNKLNSIKEAIENMMQYFQKEWERFEKRFWKSYLKILLEWIIYAKEISPEDYAKKISEKVNLIIISLKDDTLFDALSINNYFTKVKKLREKLNHKWITNISTIETDETKKAGHDAFLWPKTMQVISNKIKYLIKYSK